MHQKYGSLPQPGGRWTGAGPGGFTLVELLVVIAIVAVLASLLLPVLAESKAQGKRISCVNQQRQLSLACLLYADDHGDRLPYNLGSVEIRATVARGEFWNWTSPVMSWELDPDNTNTVLVTRGGIGPHTGSVPRLHQCPEDRVVSDLQARAGWQQRVRSISMNAMVGNAGEFSESGANLNNPYYKQFFKLTQIPKDSTIFLLIEEHPDSVNDGYFLNHIYSRRWTDLPASWHRGGANLSFADGHLEFRR